MDHRLGGIDLIRWQGRRNRRLKTGVSPWTVVLATCGIIGGAGLAAQATGLASWSGPLAPVPTVLLALALAGPLIALARAAIAWLAG